METIERKKLRPMMAMKLEKKYHIVNDSGKIYEFVGIGWINITDCHNGDCEQLPKVID